MGRWQMVIVHYDPLSTRYFSFTVQKYAEKFSWHSPLVDAFLILKYPNAALN
jgi:hypothetical protein